MLIKLWDQHNLLPFSPPSFLISLILLEETSAKKGSGVEEINKKDDATDDDNKEKVDKTTPTKKKNMNEPLRWFSAMPPASLKSSQVETQTF